MILKLLRRVEALEKAARSNAMTQGPGIRLHKRPYGTSIEAVARGKAAASAKADRPRWG